MEIPATDHQSFCKSADGRHPVQRFLLLGPLTGVLVGYAQVTVAVIVWVLHGEPDFYFRGGEGVVPTYLTLMIGGGIVGVAYTNEEYSTLHNDSIHRRFHDSPLQNQEFGRSVFLSRQRRREVISNPKGTK